MILIFGYFAVQLSLGVRKDLLKRIEKICSGNQRKGTEEPVTADSPQSHQG